MAEETPRARLAVINLLVLSLLVTLVARLWYLQVLAGPEFRRRALAASVRRIHEQAPRGFIFDRRGEVLARNRNALTVAVDPSRLPEGRRDEVLGRLASVLGMPLGAVQGALGASAVDPFTPRPVALDVRKDTVIYLLEHQSEFPGVTALEIPVREYPQGTLAAHVIGHIGRISREELAARAGYRPADLIGKMGVERSYEQYLRGRDGVREVAVDVHGEQIEVLFERAAERGWDAVLTLDAALQRKAEEALERGIQLARRLTDAESGQRFKAPGGAVVALDPQSGEILAMASSPTFDPNLFVGGPPRAALEALKAPGAHFPMLNRAIAEAVPPGSTFKPFTAAAAWDAGILNAGRTFTCPGFLKVGVRTFRDWTRTGHGTVGLRKSLVQSCDVVYYTLGVELNGMRQEAGEKLQAVARSFGFGSRTGVDVTGEEDGLVPDAAWKERRFAQANPIDRRWFPGDSANLAVGQGYLQVTPLQLAVAYAALANGGTVYRPHVLRCLAKLDVSSPKSAEEACAHGFVPQTARPSPAARIPVPPGALQAIAQSLAGTPTEGTAQAAFSGFPFDRVTVAGKTGTAQMQPRQPFSWFAAFAPVQDPKIVVVALVEEAGTGAQIAAPIVRKVLEAYFGLPEGSFEAGTRAD